MRHSIEGENISIMHVKNGLVIYSQTPWQLPFWIAEPLSMYSTHFNMHYSGSGRKNAAYWRTRGHSADIATLPGQQCNYLSTGTFSIYLYVYPRINRIQRTTTTGLLYWQVQPDQLFGGISSEGEREKQTIKNKNCEWLPQIKN